MQTFIKVASTSICTEIIFPLSSLQMVGYLLCLYEILF